jgi:UDP-glucose 4-epimerase
MHVIVTGGSGFVGSHVVEALQADGHEVTIFDASPPPESIARLPGVRFAAGDLGQLESVRAGFAGASAVCHLAGVGDVYLAAREPQRAALLNVVGTAHVAEAAVELGFSKLVYASTWEVYGRPRYQPIDEQHPCDPDHPYNVTKYAGERLALSYDHLRNLPVVALRLGTAYGLRMRPNSVFSLFIDRARRGEPLVLQGGGEQSRQFTHARDIAAAFAAALVSDVRGEAVNCVAGPAVSIRQLAEMVQRRLPTRIEYGPARAGDVAPALVSSARAAELFGWQARSDMEAALDEMIAAALPRVGAVG